MAPDLEAERYREPVADNDAVFGQITQAAGGDVARDIGLLQQIRVALAANLNANPVPGHRGDGLPFDQGKGLGHARKLRDGTSQIAIFDNAATVAIDGHCAVKAQDLAQELGPEPVHDRHHDDQGGNTKRDPQQ